MTFLVEMVLVELLFGRAVVWSSCGLVELSVVELSVVELTNYPVHDDNVYIMIMCITRPREIILKFISKVPTDRPRGPPQDLRT
jgi:hypothetical protein